MWWNCAGIIHLEIYQKHGMPSYTRRRPYTHTNDDAHLILNPFSLCISLNVHNWMLCIQQQKNGKKLKDFCGLSWWDLMGSCSMGDIFLFFAGLVGLFVFIIWTDTHTQKHSKCMQNVHVARMQAHLSKEAVKWILNDCRYVLQSITLLVKLLHF